MGVMYMYVLLCAPVCRCLGPCTYVETRGKCCLSCSTIRYLIPLRHSLSLMLKLNWQTANPSDPPIFAPPQCCSYRHMLSPLFICLFVTGVLEIWTQVLKLVWKHLTKWTATMAPGFSFETVVVHVYVMFLWACLQPDCLYHFICGLLIKITTVLTLCVHHSWAKFPLCPFWESVLFLLFWIKIHHASHLFQPSDPVLDLVSLRALPASRLNHLPVRIQPNQRCWCMQVISWRLPPTPCQCYLLPNTSVKRREIKTTG